MQSYSCLLYWEGIRIYPLDKKINTYRSISLRLWCPPSNFMNHLINKSSLEHWSHSLHLESFKNIHGSNTVYDAAFYCLYLLIYLKNWNSYFNLDMMISVFCVMYFFLYLYWYCWLQFPFKAILHRRFVGLPEALLASVNQGTSMVSFKALFSGISLQEVCDAAGCACAQTFIRFYSLNLPSTPGSQVLSSWVVPGHLQVRLGQALVSVAKRVFIPHSVVFDAAQVPSKGNISDYDCRREQEAASLWHISWISV